MTTKIIIVIFTIILIFSPKRFKVEISPLCALSLLKLRRLVWQQVRPNIYFAPWEFDSSGGRLFQSVAGPRSVSDAWRLTEMCDRSSVKYARDPPVSSCLMWLQIGSNYTRLLIYHQAWHVKGGPCLYVRMCLSVCMCVCPKRVTNAITFHMWIGLFHCIILPNQPLARFIRVT